MPAYPNAPLVLVALEVRYPSLVDGVDGSVLRKALRDTLPIPGEHREHRVNFDASAGPPRVTQQLWPRLMTRDRRMSLLVTDQALVLETSDYGKYETYRGVVERVMRVIERTVQPDGIQRVGMRFIDEIRVPEVIDPPGEWGEWIAEGLLLPVAPPIQVEGTSFQPRTWQGQAIYDADNGFAVKLTYGPQVGTAVANSGTQRPLGVSSGLFFLLDSDGSWTPENSIPEFSVDAILEACDTIHEPLSEMFKSITTEKLVSEVFKRSEKS